MTSEIGQNGNVVPVSNCKVSQTSCGKNACHGQLHGLITTANREKCFNLKKVHLKELIPVFAG